MKEFNVLVAIGSDRSDYEDVREYLNPELLTPEGRYVLEKVHKFYERDPEAGHVDWDYIQRSTLEDMNTVPKHRQMFQDWFVRLGSSLEGSVPNAVAEVREGIRRDIEIKLADAIMARDKDKVAKYMDQLNGFHETEGLDDSIEEEYSGMSVEELVGLYDTGNKIKVLPMILNRELNGGARRGHHIILVARPEVGKTMFSINMAAGFLRQGLKVLYIGNEDPIMDLIMRLISCLTGMPEEEIMEDPETATVRAREKGYDNSTFIGMSPGSISAVDLVCRKHKPDVLMLDQLRNLTATSENNTTRLDAVARGARELARKHDCLVVSVTQAGDSADNKLVLDMGDVDSSNTGIPGAADVMVMVGCNEDYRDEDARHITLAKNKIGRNHAQFNVRVIPELSRVTGEMRGGLDTYE